MPFVPNTPESLSTLLSRADSKSPSTTCCGVSNTGRPCRRELTPSKTGRPATGVIAVFNGQRVFFCEQHKDQSQNVVLRHTASFARKRELLGRGSMDTLIEQVELLVAGGKTGDVTTATTVVSKTKKVSPENDPFAAPPKNFAGPPSPPTSYQREKRRQQQQKKKPSFWTKLCCCIPEEPEENNYPRVRKEEAELRAAAAAVVENSAATTRPRRTHRPGNSEPRVGFESAPPTPPLPMMYPDRKVVHSALVNNGPRNTRPGPGGTVAGRGMTPVTPKSYTTMSDFGPLNEVNPMIPPTLSAQTVQRLQQELSKPFSEKDEPGYIYIFWLTDSPISPQGTPGGTPNGTPSKASGGGGRSTHLRNPSDALQRVVADAENAQQGQRILLKIGRANNVQRRLHEWSTQCGYNLSLIRFYPHVSASSPGSTTGNLTTPMLNKKVGKKVPNSHRIERLIHLELSDNPENRPLVQCEVCKRTHKEWFSVEASRAGLKGVDEVVKKWIEYGERSAMVTGTGPITQAPQVPKTSSPKTKGGNAAKPAASRPPPRTPTAAGGARKSPSPPTKAGRGAKNSPSSRPSPKGKEPTARAARSLTPAELASLSGYRTEPKKKRWRGGWKDYDEGDVDYCP